MNAPNSFKLSDDDIVRLYKENRADDWGKMIMNLARVAGASDKDIVSILNRRSDELGTAPVPKMTGSTFSFIRPAVRSFSMDDLMLRRVQAAKQHAKEAIDEMESLVKLLDGIELGLRESVRMGAAHG